MKARTELERCVLLVCAELLCALYWKPVKTEVLFQKNAEYGIEKPCVDEVWIGHGDPHDDDPGVRRQAYRPIHRRYWLFGSPAARGKKPTWNTAGSGLCASAPPPARQL